uniref:Uncharacterized protein n=1 Tax=Timema poppense TaxID=170557 RepID=A0A7R9GUL9_TIMPO|nr:unnamed protein product [Timema poppensis]
MSGGSILPRLKRIPSFTTSRRREPPLSLGLRHVDPMLRFSLSRLVEGAKGEVPRQDTPSPAAEARFAAGWDQKFREEWERLRKAVFDLFNWPNQPAHAQLSAGQLTALHNDVHVLLRSQAGTFIFEYYQNTLLPDASEILFEHALSSSPRHFPDTLAAIWTHFYCHTLPALEAIFVSVKAEQSVSEDVESILRPTMHLTDTDSVDRSKTLMRTIIQLHILFTNQQNHKLSIRQASLVAFRDCVIMKLESKLTPELEDQYLKKKVSPALRQMFLVLQNVSESYPPSEERIKLERLVARVVSPYMGFRGLYRDGHPDPVIKSREMDVAHLRRPSVVDPRRLTRPLSLTSARHVETLNDLFALSADRVVNKYRTYSSRDP